MNINAFVKHKKIIGIIFFAFIVMSFFALLVVSKDNDFIKNIKEYVDDDTKVLYISNKSNYSKYPIELLTKYEVDFLYIDSTNLSKIEKSKLERLINSKYLLNIIVIYKDGKVIDAIIDYGSNDKLNEFLQRNNIIPTVIGDVKNIINDVSNLLDTNLSLIYLPYTNSDYIDSQNNILNRICNQYDINYKKIDAYLLSESQKEKLNLLLQISSVDDQIVILVKNNKIIGSIRGVNKRITYLNKLYEYKEINEIENYINNIDYEAFKNLLKSESKSIILIGKDECKYCDDTISTLNQVAFNSQISINYINVGSLDSELAKKVENDLKNMNYEDGFSTPITIIVESNKLLDYAIGASNESYFIDIFTENGIIKKEV